MKQNADAFFIRKLIDRIENHFSGFVIIEVFLRTELLVFIRNHFKNLLLFFSEKHRFFLLEEVLALVGNDSVEPTDKALALIKSVDFFKSCDEALLKNILGILLVFYNLHCHKQRPRTDKLIEFAKRIHVSLLDFFNKY